MPAYLPVTFLHCRNNASIIEKTTMREENSMLENLAYCLNATAPIFLLMLLGLVFRRLGFFSQAFADKLNDFVFKVGLPVMLFKDLVESDFFTVWDGPFVLFCFLATLAPSF